MSMTEIKITAEALKYWRKKRGLTQVQLGDMAKVTQSYISNVEEGNRRPSIDMIEQISKALGLSLAEFFSCKDDRLPDIDFVPLVKAVPRAGTGGLETDEDFQGLYSFHSSFLVRKQGSPETMRLFCIQGNSMEPTLQAGDMIMINQSMQDIRSGSVYLIRLEGELMVKRLENRPGGLLLIRSDNPSYETIPVQKDNESIDFAIFGRMVWSCREY